MSKLDLLKVLNIFILTLAALVDSISDTLILPVEPQKNIDEFFSKIVTPITITFVCLIF